MAVWVMGPAFLAANPNSGVLCTSPDGWYPWEEKVFNPKTNKYDITKNYRRNPCFGQKEYPPPPPWAP